MLVYQREAVWKGGMGRTSETDVWNMATDQQPIDIWTDSTNIFTT